MPYTAVLRWKGPDPALELETRHAGFAIPEEAALFANSFTDNSPERLHLTPESASVETVFRVLVGFSR